MSAVTTDQLVDEWLDFPSEVERRDGRVGRLGGIFPPEREIELLVVVDEPWECLDGTHVAACWGTVLHTHATRTDRVSASMLDVVAVDGRAIEVVS